MTIPLLAAALTIVIEATVFVLLRYRGRVFFSAVALINLASNITLNLTLALLPDAMKIVALVILELAVVAVEWFTLRWFTDRSRNSLLFAVLLANVASLSCGLLLF